MAKPLKRECPACHKVKEFRSDQKTCGCRGTNPTTKQQTEKTAAEEYLRKEVIRLNMRVNALLEKQGANEEIAKAVKNAAETLEPLPPVPYKIGRDASKTEVAAVLKLSDWHIGAYTPQSATEGFGQFNWEIAQQRVNYITRKFLGWVETQRRSYNIPKLYILSEGDMISGDIHYELQVTNEFPAPVQAVNAGSLLAQSIATMAPYFPEVHVSEINIDNHSRLTKKLQFAQGDENSWGYVVHAVANNALQKHGNINIIQSKGIRQIVDIQGIKFLTEHGHEVKAWMGIPFYGIERFRGREASKRMSAMLQQMRTKDKFKEYVDNLQKEIGFDYISQGHWHVPGVVSGNILINGCLPGTTEFDHAMGRSAPPAQVGFLVHPKHKLFNWVPWGAKY